MKIGIIGCGTMGKAFGASFLNTGHEVMVIDKDYQKCTTLVEKGAILVEDLSQLSAAEVILLAIKPKDLSQLAESLGGGEGQLIISIMAGVPLAILEEAFPNSSLARCMPNVGVLVNQMVLGVVEDERLSAAYREKIERLFKDMGMILWLEENLLDPLTALSGSGIAFVYLMMESMIDAGIFLGFSKEHSKDVVLQVFKAAALLLESSDDSIYELKQQICSPGGTTIYGLEKLEECRIRFGIMQGVIAACERGKSLEEDSSK